MLLRRLQGVLLCAISIYLSFIIVSGASDGSKDARQPFNFFIDVNSSRLADQVNIQKKRVDLAGFPIVVSGSRQNGAAPSITAGIAGSHDFELGNNVIMKASGLVSRVHTAGAGILSGGRVGGDTAIKYQHGDSGLLLRPSIYATLQNEVLERTDYELEGKAWQPIGAGIDATATVGRCWRVSESLSTDSRESGYGRLGLDMDLFEGTRLELAYGFSTVDGLLASQPSLTQGPTIMTHLAVAPGWRIDIGDSLAATRRGYTDLDEDARRHDLRHRLGLKSDWDISSTTGAEWHVSATYDYEQTVTDDPVTVPASHNAIVNFTLNF